MCLSVCGFERSSICVFSNEPQPLDTNINKGRLDVIMTYLLIALEVPC